VLLLDDLRRLFQEDGRTFIKTGDLLDGLNRIEERPWGTWGKQEKGLTAHALAGLLRRFRVHARSNGQARGYQVEPELAEAWARYLDPAIPPTEVSKCQTTNHDGAESLFSKCQGTTGADTLKIAQIPIGIEAVDTLTLREGGIGHSATREPESEADEDDDVRTY
jgi:hypothetical protein